MSKMKLILLVVLFATIWSSCGNAQVDVTLETTGLTSFEMTISQVADLADSGLVRIVLKKNPSMSIGAVSFRFDSWCVSDTNAIAFRAETEDSTYLIVAIFGDKVDLDTVMQASRNSIDNWISNAAFFRYSRRDSVAVVVRQFPSEPVTCMVLRLSFQFANWVREQQFPGSRFTGISGDFRQLLMIRERPPEHSSLGVGVFSYMTS